MIGVRTYYSDPNVPVFPEMREHDFDLSSVDLSPEALGEYDAVVLLTDHTGFDYEMIKTNAKLLIDTAGNTAILRTGIISGVPSLAAFARNLTGLLQ